MYYVAPGVAFVADAKNNPVIGYVNKITEAGLSTSTEDALFPAINMANTNTWQLWHSASTTTEFVTFTSFGGATIDYIGFARHNWGTLGAQVTIYGATDGVPTYVPISQHTITDDGPLIFRIPPAVYTHLQLILTTSGSSVFQAAVAFAGNLLTIPRNVYVGHTPLSYGREYTQVTGQSEGGHFLGRVVVGETLSTSMELKHLKPDWYRSTFDPFAKASATTPFFVAWRPNDYPAETGFAWLTGTPKPSNMLPNGMMEVTLSMSGVSVV